MSSGEFGAGSKKETIYDGPGPITPSASGYIGTAAKPIKETVYGPGTGGTVYGGPDTVNNPAGSTRAAQTKTVATDGKSSRVFFLVAVFSLINTLLLSSGALAATAIGLGITRILYQQASQQGGEAGPVFLLSAVLIAVFAGLGLFARRGNSLAFLIGLLIYGADTVILCYDGVLIHIPAIIIHGIFLAGMLKGYRDAKE